MKKFTLFLLSIYLLIPISVYAYSDYIMASGKNIGIELKSNNVIIVGAYNLGNYNALKETDLHLGDKIVKINNYDVTSVNNMQDIINKIGDSNVLVTYKRGDSLYTSNINLYKENNEYKTGLYVRDTIRGVATLTYIDTNNKTFGALGHEILEKSTKSKFESDTGTIFYSEVTGITKSTDGNPGEKNARSNSYDVFGEVVENTTSGIFGNYTSTLPQSKMYKVAKPSEINLGEAKILTVIDGDKVEAFGINILKINTNSNTNLDSINVNDSNHYITIIKGNTNYELIHGYSTKKKDDKNDSFSELSNDKNKINNNYNSLTISNNITKNNKNRVTLQDGYNEIILKKQTDIEYLKQKEEKKLKESCTFKPTINSMNKKMFNNNIKVDLPKHRMNKSVNIYNNGNNNINKTNIKLRKNKSNLQKMFDTNPLKNDKGFNERVQILKSVKSNEINDDNYLITPMRFNIDYPSKFEGMGITINRESGIRQFAPNIIFYNIKVNDKIRTLKYIEGDDLKLNVINFVKKNKLPEEVVNIILKKIKEKELEEKITPLMMSIPNISG